MARFSATLQAIIDATKAKAGALLFKKSTRSMQTESVKTASTMSKLKGAVIALGGSFLLLRSAKFITRELSEMEETNAQLAAGLKSTGGISGQTVKSLQDLATELQRTTKFGDETVKSAEGILLSFTNIADDVFPRTVRAAADVSTRMGQDLSATMIQLGKAINDPVANLGALSRSGIQFSKTQKATIKVMVETNRMADAQRLILKELENQYGGSAAAARDTLGGALQSLKNSLSDLTQEAFGATEMSGVFETIAGSIDKFTDNLETMRVAVANVFLRIRFGGKMVGQVFTFIGEKVGFFIAEMTETTIAGINELVRGSMQITQQFLDATAKGLQRVRGMSGVAQGLKESAAAIRDFRSDLERTPQAFKEVEPLAKRLSETVKEQDEAVKALARSWDKAGENIEKAGDKTDETGKKLADTVTAMDRIKGAAKNFGSTIAGGFEAAVFEAKSLSDALKDLGRDVARLLFRTLITQPIAAGISGAITGSADGNVFTRPGITSIAERGEPEAVVPLKRDSQGQLGLNQTGGSQKTEIINNITVQAWDRQDAQRGIIAGLSQIQGQRI